MSGPLPILAGATAAVLVLANAVADAKSVRHSAVVDVKKMPSPPGPVPVPYPNIAKTAKTPATYLRGKNGGNRKGGRYLAQ